MRVHRLFPVSQTKNSLAAPLIHQTDQIKQVNLPVIRKDFILDPYQILQARAHMALTRSLLIAECLSDTQISQMLDLANDLDLAVLIESHSARPISSASSHSIKASPHQQVLMGVNNRDLSRMVTELSNTARLAPLVEDRSVLVSESGIKTPDDLTDLRAWAVHIVLVGEHLMRQQHPGNALCELLKPITSSG